MPIDIVMWHAFGCLTDRRLAQLYGAVSVLPFRTEADGIWKRQITGRVRTVRFRTGKPKTDMTMRRLNRPLSKIPTYELPFRTVRKNRYVCGSLCGTDIVAAKWDLYGNQGNKTASQIFD